MSRGFWVIPASPHDTLTRFFQALCVWGAGQGVTRLRINTNLKNPHLNLEAKDRVLANNVTEHEEVSAFLQLLAERSFVEVTNCEVTLGNNYKVAYEQVNTRGEFSITEVQTVEHEVSILDALTGAGFDLLRESVAIRKGLPQGFAREYQIQQEATVELRSVVGDLGRHVTEQSKKLDQSFEKWVSEVQGELERKRKALEDEFEEKEASLSSQREQLEAERAALDLETYKAGRRAAYRRLVMLLTGVESSEDEEPSKGVESNDQEVRGGTQESVRVRSDVTRSITGKHRWQVHVIAVLALIAFGVWGGAWLSFLTGLADKDYHWKALLPLTAAVVGFGSTLAFYLSWLKRWSADHSEREFLNLKLSADVMRAHWVAELLFEWQQGSSDNNQSKLPPEILDRFSNNLFLDKGKPSVEHPIIKAANALPDLVTRLEERLKKLPTGLA